MTPTVEDNLSNGRWVPIPAAGCETLNQTLNQTTLDLWRIPLEQPVQLELLSEDELARFKRYRFAADQRKFAVARSSLRRILASYVQTDPASLTFDYGSHGKPALRHGGSLQFNLSHSGEYALCAVARQAVGVDIEHLRSMNGLAGMIERCLAPSEQHTLAQVPLSEQNTGFFRYWTCKEAYLKATGQGISESLAAIEVELEPAPKIPGPWQLWVFIPCDGYTAAVVSSPDIDQIRLWAYANKPVKPGQGGQPTPE